MLSQLQSSYQRVEAGVQKLADSIAAYNPSVAASEELLAADEVVNEDLEQLIVHQRNFLRITELRRTAASLDEATKTTIKLLAGLRRDIQSIPALRLTSVHASAPSTQSRSAVHADELLSYARFISKTTVPPTLRASAVNDIPRVQLSISATPAKVEATNSIDGIDVQMTNGIATPPLGTQDVKDAISNNLDSTNATALEQNIGIKTLEERDRAWLNPASLPFEPWPSQEKMQSGALGEIQRIRERGEDPANVLTAEEKETEEARKREEEERERREQEVRMAKYGLGLGSLGGRRLDSANDVPFNPDDL